MDDDKIDLGSDDGMKIEKSKAGKWLENFFYHYKWHTIVALFVIAAVIVCTVTMCGNKKSDVYILYAGSRDIKGSHNSDGMGISDYTKVHNAMLEVTRDFNDDGEKVISLEALYMLSNDEIKALEEELKKQNEENGTAYELQYALLDENNKTFSDRMLYGEYYVCILSESLYKAYREIDGVTVFTPLAPFVDEGNEVEYLDESAIYLRSLGFSELPGISEMPEDTVIALRTMSVISSKFNKKENQKLYDSSKEVIRNIINYEY